MTRLIGLLLLAAAPAALAAEPARDHEAPDEARDGDGQGKAAEDAPDEAGLPAEARLEALLLELNHARLDSLEEAFAALERGKFACDAELAMRLDQLTTRARAKTELNLAAAARLELSPEAEEQAVRRAEAAFEPRRKALLERLMKPAQRLWGVVGSCKAHQRSYQRVYALLKQGFVVG
ncbi:MAG TPA: hypothetical protein PK668_12550 [Myxococcota bacterium]|nr:hypothetical protein [Myxococcota bacterium]HRY93700.1 hypothetical protein [Myxococcota bacterium]